MKPGPATSALAIAKHFGCWVVVTSRHQSKLDKAKVLGADAGVLDKGQDWSKEVRALTSKRGVDVAVDSSGKSTHLNCIKSLARGGAYLTPGCTSGPDAVTDLARILALCRGAQTPLAGVWWWGWWLRGQDLDFVHFSSHGVCLILGQLYLAYLWIAYLAS